MSRVTITCVGCGQKWLVATSFSVYEQQATESPVQRRGPARAEVVLHREPFDRQSGIVDLVTELAQGVFVEVARVLRICPQPVKAILSLPSF